MLNVQVYGYPLSSIKKRKSAGFVVADLLGDMFKVSWADGAGLTPQSLAAINPTISLDWAAKASIEQLENLGLVQFCTDGTVLLGARPRAKGARAGVFIFARLAALDSQIGDNSDSITAGNTAIHWTEEQGKWLTTQSKGTADSAKGTGIHNVSSDMTCVATTEGTIPANRCFEGSIHLLRKNKDGLQPRARLAWGNKYSIVFEDNCAISLERKASTGSGVAKWTNWKTFSDLSPADFGNKDYQVQVWRIDGKLVIFIDGASGSGAYWLAETSYDTTRRQGKTFDVTWPEAHLRFNAYNCVARLEVGVIKWAESGGAPLTGLLTRLIPRKTVVDPNAAVQPVVAGWVREGVTAAVQSPTITAGYCEYTLTMAGNADGIACPFVDRVSLRYLPVWSTVGFTSLNLRPALVDLTISKGLAPQVAGDECTITLNRKTLESKCSGWESMVGLHCPIRVLIQCRGNYPARVFVGHVFVPGKETAGYNQQSLTIVCKDKVSRLQGDNCRIDHRYPPLDLYFGEKAQGFVGPSGLPLGTASDLYIADCVQELLRIGVSDFEADSMNGNGNARRFLEPGHLSLLNNDNDLSGMVIQAGLLNQQVPGLTAAGFYFAPPFLDDMQSWFSKLSKDDKCEYWWGHPTSDLSDDPVFIWARYSAYIANAVTRRVADADYISGDIQRLVKHAKTERRGDKDPNGVLVLSQALEGLDASLFPALRIAFGQIPSTDPRSAAFSWERNQAIREPIALYAAEAIMYAAVGLITGVDLQWPTLTIRGDERWRIGDLVHMDMSGARSDPSLGLDALTQRVERIEHKVVVAEGDDGFTTTLYPRPLTAIERSRL